MESVALGGIHYAKCSSHDTPLAPLLLNHLHCVLGFLLLKSKMGLIIADFGEKREEGIWSLHPSG